MKQCFSCGGFSCDGLARTVAKIKAKLAAEAPQEDFVATIDGVSIDGQTADLLTSTGDVISINTEMLQTATEDDIEAFSSLMFLWL